MKIHYCNKNETIIWFRYIIINSNFDKSYWAEFRQFERFPIEIIIKQRWDNWGKFVRINNAY